MYKKLEKSRDMISINWQVTLSWVQNKIWGWKNCWRWNGKIYALWWWGQKQRLGCLISTFRDIRNICEYKVKRVNMKVAELQEISLDRGGWENVRIWYWVIYMGIKIPKLGDRSGGTEEVGAKFIHEIERWGTDMIWYLFFVAFLLFVSALGLHCCAQAFSSYDEHGLHSSCGAWASHCSGFSCEAGALGLWASVVVVQELSCPGACGIFWNQGSNLCPLHWQAGP